MTQRRLTIQLNYAAWTTDPTIQLRSLISLYLPAETHKHTLRHLQSNPYSIKPLALHLYPTFLTQTLQIWKVFFRNPDRRAISAVAAIYKPVDVLRPCFFVPLNSLLPTLLMADALDEIMSSRLISNFFLVSSSTSKFILLICWEEIVE